MHDASLNELKNLILSKFEITIISPSDCQHIATTISKKLNKTISTTTVKRIFGFAEVKYNFSKFTINSLLEFVGYPMVGEANDSNDQKDTDEWLRIDSVAKKISQSTLKSIISNSTIPFRHTVTRKFALKEFEYFYQTNFSFTSFIGQPGCGKSILLAHIIQQLHLKAKSKYEKDIFLFLNAKNLFTIDDEKRDFATEIKRVLNLSDDQNIITLFNNIYEKTGHKVIIIIDSFDDLFSLTKGKSIIFEKIIYWLCQIEDSKAIKVVVSMRSNFWLKFHALIRNSHYLKKKWYKGKNYSEKDISNVPSLNQQEIETILQQIGSKPSNAVNSFIKSPLKYPFYFKYYYLLKDEYNHIKFHTDIMCYEIYWRFILEKIYRSNLSNEKLTICKKIMQLSDFSLKVTAVPKKMFFQDFFMFKQAYMELLAEGIIIERKTIINGLFVETVSFVHHHFFDFFLVKELTEQLPNTLTHNTVEQIMVKYPKTLVESLIKWMIFTTVSNSDYKFSYLLNDHLPENPNLVLFVVENIKHQLHLKPRDLTQLKKITKLESLIKYAIVS